jgi:hypothetical protein
MNMRLCSYDTDLGENVNPPSCFQHYGVIPYIYSFLGLPRHSPLGDGGLVSAFFKGLLAGYAAG